MISVSQNYGFERVKSLMAEWLEQASQRHEIYCHGLEVMSLNPGWVELGVLEPQICTFGSQVSVLHLFTHLFHKICFSIFRNEWRNPLMGALCICIIFKLHTR